MESGYRQSQVNFMAKIRINDLTDSIELDQAALSRIYGGASSQVRKPDPLESLLSKPELSLLTLARTKRLLRR